MNPILDALDRKAAFSGMARYESSCNHKIRFESERQAKDAARTMHKKFKRQFSHYRCTFCSTPECSQWHIGGRRKELEYQPL